MGGINQIQSQLDLPSDVQINGVALTVEGREESGGRLVCTGTGRVGEASWDGFLATCSDLNWKLPDAAPRLVVSAQTSELGPLATVRLI